MSNAGAILRRKNGEGDVRCSVCFWRSGNVTDFSDGDGSIDTCDELDAALDLPGWVKVVNQINACGYDVNNKCVIKPVAGCGRQLEPSFVVTRLPTVSADSIIWAHEFGHNKGLHHRKVYDLNAIMNETNGPTSKMVNAEECAAYKEGGGHILKSRNGSRKFGPQQPRAAGGSDQIDIRDFVRHLFIHGVPYEEANRYGSAAVPTLLTMLRDPAEEQHWSNIVVVLGMIGDEQAVEPLISFIEAGSQTNISSEHYRAKTSALMSLGYIINKTGNQRALNYLRESVWPETWASRSVVGIAPFQASTAERNSDFSKHAILGLALSGRPEAAEILRSLQQPAKTDTERAFKAEVSNLVSHALKEHDTISRVGLYNYYRSSQQ